jgi:hypothetical protein
MSIKSCVGSLVARCVVFVIMATIVFIKRMLL